MCFVFDFLASEYRGTTGVVVSLEAVEKKNGSSAYPEMQSSTNISGFPSSPVKRKFLQPKADSRFVEKKGTVLFLSGQNSPH